MSYFEDASVVFIPSAVKDGKTYSIKPTDGTGDLTFSRGSDIEATRVASNGYIEKAKVNLLLQSNQFDTTWTSSRVAILGGQSGYDGTNNAWKITPNTDNNTHVVVQAGAVAANGVYNFSVYAKANGYNYIALRDSASVDGYARFDLQNGLTSTSGTSAISSKITSVGGGWYRCELSVNKTSGGADNFIIYTNETYSFNEVYVGDGTSSVLIQSAQANYGLVAQEYQETTTTSVVSGITNDMPRLDYSGGASCPSLKLEPSRSNEMPNSEYLAGWTAFTNIAITQNQTTSPEGVTNGVLMARTGSGDLSGAVRYTGISTTANSKCYSVFAKANAHNYIQLYHSGDAQGYVNFDLSTGAVGTSGSKASGTIESYGSGWYRCTAIYDNTNAFGSSYYVGFAASASSGYAGGAVPDTASVYLYGAQIESSASYSSSYLPTYGTSATRTADSCSKTGISSLIGQTEGTIYAEVDFDSSVDTEGYIVRIDESSFNDTIFVARGGDKILSGVLRSSGSTIAQLQKTAFNGVNKLAFAYKSGSFALYVNGTQVATSAATYTNGITYDEIRIGGFNAATANMCGGVKQTLLFTTRLSNADLATLTA